MKLIQPDAIKISPHRQRREFDPQSLHELADSIQRLGLLHPIILRVVGEDYVLVSGERRLRAIKDIYALGGSFKHDGEVVKYEAVPYTNFDDLDPLAAEEAELDENLKRDDLTPQEEAAAVARLVALRKTQAEVAGSPTPTPQDIATELAGRPVPRGSYADRVRKQLIVAQNLHRPEVAEARTLDEAFKALKRTEEASRNVALGTAVGRTFTADAHRAILADSCEWLRTQPSGVYDVILTDPPYGMGADSFDDSGRCSGTQHQYLDDEATWVRLMDVFCDMSCRITKSSAHLYVFCDIEHFFDLRGRLTDSGWNVFRTPLVWFSRTSFRMPWPEHGPQRKYELILFAEKGKRNVLKIAGDVLEHTKDPADPELTYAARKPVALFHDLLSRSCRPGDSVLDPFAGSGPVFPAAHELKVRATGVEMNPEAYGMCVRRIEGLKVQRELAL